MIEETVEMDNSEEIYDSEDSCMDSEEGGSIVPVIAAVGVIGGAVAGTVVAVKKTHFIGRVKSAASGFVKGFKEYEVPEEENIEESDSDVEINPVEDPAE